MFTNLRLNALVLALPALLSLSQAKPSSHIAARDDCAAYGDGYPSVIYVSTNVVAYPVLIDTYIAANTVIVINGGVTINIDNAPTSLSTIVTATSTVTSTLTATVTAPPIVPAGVEFVIAVISGVLTKGKRQLGASGYLSFALNTAEVVADKADAALFSITNGQLFSGGGFVGLEESDLTTGYGPFELFPAQPDISTTWTAEIGSVISFSNGAFSFGGFAEFCESDDGAIFNQYTTAPTFACALVELIAESVGSASSTSSATTTTSSSSSSSTSADTSGDLSIPDPTNTLLPRVTGVKRAVNHGGKVRRGGMLKSPYKQ